MVGVGSHREGRQGKMGEVNEPAYGKHFAPISNGPRICGKRSAESQCDGTMEPQRARSTTRTWKLINV